MYICHRSIINLRIKRLSRNGASRLGKIIPIPHTSRPPPPADLYPLHLQEGGHLKSLLPDEELAVQLHAEEQVLPRLRLDAEAVLPLVQEVVVLGGEGAAQQVQQLLKRTRVQLSRRSEFFSTLPKR